MAESLVPSANRPLSFSPQEVFQAAAQARRAFDQWRCRSFRERGICLERIRRRLAQEAASWAGLISEDVGKPILEALGSDLLGSLEALRLLVRRGQRWLAPEPIPRSRLDRLRGSVRARLIYEPLGVVGVIGTWNYPLGINLAQIASALFCGNAVLWKPSELALRTAERLERLFQEAGLPPGLFTALPGDGVVGEHLLKAGCDKILFTGQGRTGRKILSQLSEQGIPAILELSGMDPALVCRDAPVPLAAEGLAWGAMTAGGQSCVAARRLIVDERLLPRFLPAFLERVRSLRVGDPRDPATEIGPLRTPEQVERLEGLIGEALSSGATLLAGGGRLRDRAGRFFQPTVLAGLNHSLRIVQEEFFGPVALILPARDEEEMVALANRSAYGLGASVWTRDLRRGRRLALDLQAGVVWVNEVLVSAGDFRLPFGGLKGSGFGRVHGAQGLRQLTNLKCIEENRPGRFRPHYFPYSRKKYEQLLQLIRWRHA